MKNLIRFVLLVLLLSCQKAEKVEEFMLFEVQSEKPEGNLRFYVESNCLYPDSVKVKLKDMIRSGASRSEIIKEARKLISKDTVLMKKDTLYALVKVEFSPRPLNYSVRVNGFQIYTNEVLVPIYPDSICLWIKARGASGKLEGNFYVNKKKQTFKFDPYSPLTEVIKKYTLKDFKESLPNKQVPLDSLQKKDSTISLLQVKRNKI